MTASTYIAGVLVVGVVFGSWAFASHALMRALAPTWAAVVRGLGTALLTVGAVIVSALVVGTFEQFARVPLVVVSVVGATATAVIARRRATNVAPITNPMPSLLRRANWKVRFPEALALASTTALFAQWFAGAVTAFGRGIDDVDSMAYHLPQAVRFAQDQSTSALHYAGPNVGTAYYPSNSELLHGIGIVAFHADVMSLLLNLAFLALGLLAAYCIGRRFGTGPVAMIGYSVLGLVPLLADRIAGSAFNDYTAIAFFLTAIVFALHHDDAHAPVAIGLAGLAAGLALGTKLTLVAPVAGLSITMWWLTRKQWRHLLLYSGAVSVGGGYWYVRNFVRVGNPVPSLDIGLFPSPPMSLVERASPAVSSYLGNRDFLFDFAPSALNRFFGAAWPLIILVCVGGLVAWALVLRTRDVPNRAAMVGIVATLLVGSIAYLFMPTSAGDANGVPFLFVYNLRYVLPAFIPALVLVTGLPVLGCRQPIVAAAGGGLVIATLLSTPRIEPRELSIATLLAVAVVVFTALPSAARRAVVAAAIAGAVCAGLPLAQRYERNRYTAQDTPRARLFSVGRNLPADARVAIVGRAEQYPFNGPNLETRVDYLGEFRANHEFTNIDDCDAWRVAVREGNYDFVVAEPPDRKNLPPAAEWTSTLPGARTVRRTTAGTIYDVRRVTNWPNC